MFHVLNCVAVTWLYILVRAPRLAYLEKVDFIASKLCLGKPDFKNGAREAAFSEVSPACHCSVLERNFPCPKHKPFCHGALAILWFHDSWQILEILEHICNFLTILVLSAKSVISGVCVYRGVTVSIGWIFSGYGFSAILGRNILSLFTNLCIYRQWILWILHCWCGCNPLKRVL